MIEPRFRWRIAAPVSMTAEFIGAAGDFGIGEQVAGLLASRGIADPSTVRAFMAEPAAGLLDPRLLPDAELGLARCVRARAQDERVLVCGDFDADGLTGLAIMVRALRAFGLDVAPYVPSRMHEGHGLSLRAVEAARSAGRTLIVTVDTGSSSVEEVAAAHSLGIDVLITDHHRVPELAPLAVALVNPKCAGSTYPDLRLTGSGVAFKFAELLLADVPGGREIALGLADLAVIGTVGDLGPVLGENRSIARLGLALLRSGSRPGIAAILERAGVGLASIDLETIAFAIAPRINSAGRVGSAMDAAELLLTDDPVRAAELAANLDTANTLRREMTRSAIAEAQAVLAADPGDPSATVVRGDWPVGVIGLVASRLVQERGCPAVVGTEVDGVVRASCRAGAGFDLGAALTECADLFVRFGGHAGAAGFDVPVDRWDAFRTRFLALVGSRTTVMEDPRQELHVDLVVPAARVDYAFCTELARLAPTGPGNPDPLVAVEGLTVTRVRTTAGGHTQLTLRRQVDVLDGIAFGRSDLAGSLHDGDRVDVVGRVTSRRYGGFESIQLEIRDVGPAGHAASLGQGGGAVLTGAWLRP